MVNSGVKLMNRDETGLRFSALAEQNHIPLVQRAQAVVASFGRDAAIEVRDATEPRSTTEPRATLVTLERAPQPAIERSLGGRRWRLRYTDGMAESTLAALLACSTPAGAPIAADPESLSILALAERLAASEIPVLINGPTGTGKEVLSRFIHDRSPRADKPFIAINCAAMPEAMLEAMLFGHQKGAFTGANSAAEGFFRAAHGGTLLLDEIAEMP